MIIIIIIIVYSALKIIQTNNIHSQKICTKTKINKKAEGLCPELKKADLKTVARKRRLLTVNTNPSGYTRTQIYNKYIQVKGTGHYWLLSKTSLLTWCISTYA